MLRAAAEDIRESRTSDLVILTIPQNATLTTNEAAERINAITQTEAVLVDAGVSDQARSTQVVSARVDELMAKVSVAPNARKLTIDKLDLKMAVEPVKGIDMKVFEGLNKAAIAAAAKPCCGG
ncbi:hypothetical protein BH18ACI5_BH18ACI5_06630 [soil metagenome]